MRQLLILSLGLLLLGALIQPALAHDINELQAIACGAKANPERDFRAAAAQVLADLFAATVLDAKVLPTATLNAAATDANPECRAAAVDALAQRILVEQAPLNTAKTQALHDGVKNAASFELGLAQSEVVVEIVRNGFINRGAQEAVRRSESVASGGKENILGVNLDGSTPAVRAAVSRYFLTGFYRAFGNLVFGDANATCDALRARAREGASPEVRAAAATAYVSGVVVDRKETKCVAGDGLIMATLRGSAAVQAAVVNAAAGLMAGSSLTDVALINLALDRTGRSARGAGITDEDLTTSSFRLAAGRALGLRWAKRAEKENLLADEGVVLLPGILPYNLKVYVAVFSTDSPEASAAAVAPLVVLFSKD